MAWAHPLAPRGLSSSGPTAVEAAVGRACGKEGTE